MEYDYQPYGPDDWMRLRFSGVGAFAFTHREACTDVQIDAYDRILEVANSSWLRRVRGVGKESENAIPMRHFRMYFDEYGCYDIAAETFDRPR